MMLETLTTRPLAFRTRGSTLRVTSITPNRFTSRIFTKSCLVSHSLGAVGVEMPALFTRPQSPGNSEGKRATLCRVTFRPGRTLGERPQWEWIEQRLPCSWGFRETRPSEEWEDRRPASLLTQSSHPTQCLVTRNRVTRNHSLWMQVLSFRRSSVPMVWNLRMNFWMFTIHIAFADINIPLTFQIFWQSAQ